VNLMRHWIFKAQCRKHSRSNSVDNTRSSAHAVT